MAVQKTSAGKTTKKPPVKPASTGRRNRMSLSAVLWIFLLIVIITAFFALLPIIKNLNLFTKIAEIEKQNEQSPTTPLFKLPEQKPSASAQDPQPTTKTPEKKPAEKPAVTPPEQKTAKPQTQPEKKPQPEKPAAPVPLSTTPAQPYPPSDKPVETRNRSIYLIQEITMTPVKINRSLKVSDTPLKDSLTALLAGPTADERKRGIISLVPAGSKLLSVKVEGTTAYLNFNEEFQYNTRGREGCAAQLRQIVWTATEFANIQNVQFLIEGEIVDSFPEGIMINSPISR